MADLFRELVKERFGEIILSLESKFRTAEEAAAMIQNGEVIGISGFTLSGYPKKVPKALALRAEKLHQEGKPFEITLFSGASTGESCDGALAQANAISLRAPYQSNSHIRNKTNTDRLGYLDEHLGVMGRLIREKSISSPTTAIIELAHITEDGKAYFSTSGGNSLTYIEHSSKIILEINTRYGESFIGLHDVYVPDLTPGAMPIPIRRVNDRAGQPFVQINTDKIVAIVFSDEYDEVKPFTSPDRIAQTIAGHILEFIEWERKKGKLQKELAYQSGVGNVANAVFESMANNPKQEQINIFTEVIQEACIPLLKQGKLGFASGTALTFSPKVQDEFLRNINDWKKHFILRQQEVSNNAEVIRRVGVISMNTALEFDIFGNVNSSHICGSSIMNGIGGSADFARNARLGFFMSPSTAKDGDISAIVPLVSHVDHTDHDTMIFVTEQGLADLRGLTAKQKAYSIIEHCAHPDYKDELKSELEYGIAHAKGKHIPVVLERAFNFHNRLLNTGSMKG